MLNRKCVMKVFCKMRIGNGFLRAVTFMHNVEHCAVSVLQLSFLFSFVFDISDSVVNLRSVDFCHSFTVEVFHFRNCV